MMTKYQGDIIIVLLAHMTCFMIWDYANSDLSMLWPLGATFILIRLYHWGSPDRRKKAKVDQ